jgi:hypothetical protein
MCRPTRCRTCGKTTWAGCGSHVAQVRAAVPAAQWCAGHPDSSGRNSARGGWLSRILGM